MNSDMVEDGSFLQKVDDSTELMFSPDFVQQLTHSADILDNRMLGEGGAFLAELSFTFKPENGAGDLGKSEIVDDSSYHAFGDSKFVDVKMCRDEHNRYQVAKNQFQNFQYFAVTRTLDPEICSSPKSSFLRFYAEFKQFIRTSSPGKQIYIFWGLSQLCVTFDIL